MSDHAPNNVPQSDSARTTEKPAPRMGCGGCVLRLFLAGALFSAGTVAVLLLIMWLTREPALQPMYGSETVITAIESCLRAYRRDHEGENPPSGPQGLQMATDSLNKFVVYLPYGPPKDYWNQDCVYVEKSDYDKPGSLAMKDPRTGQFFNPDTYQIYSHGEDGVSVLPGPDPHNDDDINNWSGWWNNPWREVYRKRLETKQQRHEDTNAKKKDEG